MESDTCVLFAKHGKNAEKFSNLNTECGVRLKCGAFLPFAARLKLEMDLQINYVK